MLDFGAANNNTNAINMGDLAGCELTGNFSFHIWGVLRHNLNNAYLFGKYHGGTTKGYLIYTTFGTGEMILLTADGATESDAATTAIDVDGTSVTTYGISYDGSNSDFYKGGAPDGTPAHTKNCTFEGSANVFIGDVNASTAGGAWRVGHIMMWNTALAGADFTTLNNKVTIPSRANLRFWHKGTAHPGADVYSGSTGSDVNTVALYAHESDGYYEAPGSFSYMIAQWAPPLIASGLFGANILHEKMDKLLPVMRKIMGCQFFGDWNDYVRILGAVTRRPTWLHLAPTNVL